MATIYIDDKAVEATPGDSLLSVCLKNGIYVPHLCYLEELKETPASCRLCFVEVEGEPAPVTACTTMVREDLRVRTDTPEVRRLQRAALRLLLSVHRVDCGRCPANKHCDLQRIAALLGTGLKPKNLALLLREPQVVRVHPLFDYYPNRCVLCGRCVRLCRERHAMPLLTFADRGFSTTVTFYGQGNSEEIPCADCRACVKACPVAALWPRDSDAPVPGGEKEPSPNTAGSDPAEAGP
ncbi:MAG: (2Fe-2S)-binding protein [Deltaproteobacteria bacterium]|nr:(2Fe-2S)-binding protein [Deltaproteobacteria bacterium]MBW2008404.1 (2Fe-2S)-binding protein [Deltaproteobacteria bacterium]MBW2103952.1 (2Fe-2S)-binding protein [Deltaproteobacteria bacterium]